MSRLTGFIQTIKNKQMAESKKIEVGITQVLGLLKEGYARYKKQDKGKGSVQEKLGLSRAQVKKLFLHSALKGQKTKSLSADDITIVDDRA